METGDVREILRVHWVGVGGQKGLAMPSALSSSSSAAVILLH